MKRATIIRRSLVGLVCTVGVGAMYLAPSLAGPPEQIAVPAPTEEPTIEPTPFETPFEDPSPFESTAPEPLPTETAATEIPTTSVPTTTFPTTDPTTVPPYVPPKTSKPKKTKTPKPPKIELGSVTVTISKTTSTGFIGKWEKVANAKGYAVSGCGEKTTTKGRGIAFKFGQLEKCSFKVTAQGSGSYKDGPTTTTTVLPKLDTPIVTLAKNAVPSESFTLNWKAIAGATDYKIDSGSQCTGPKDIASSANPTIKITFNTQATNVCTITVQAESEDKLTASDTKPIIVNRDDLKPVPPKETG